MRPEERQEALQDRQDHAQGGGDGLQWRHCQNRQCLSPTGRIVSPPTSSQPPGGCPGGMTACAGACVDTSADSTNCGARGSRCSINETRTARVCTCGDGGDPCSSVRTGSTSCLRMDGSAVCAFARTTRGALTDPTTCTSVATCPTKTVVCVGAPGNDKSCCPLDTTCDSATGACLQ